MTVEKFLHTVDGISTWVGKACAWLIIGLMLLVCAEVFKRYILNMPTAWIFDASNMFYGTLFMMCGAYTLAQNAHVRGDFLYSSMRPRTQATLDLILYFVFFIPGIAALVYAGTDYAMDSGASPSTPTSPRTVRRFITSRPSFRSPARLSCFREWLRSSAAWSA